MEEFDNFSDLYQVTSDCRPWLKGGHLCICKQCSTVQKPVTNQWLDDVNEIYSRYEMYSQTDGLEQRTFDKSSGISEVRSKKIVSWLSDYSLPSTGTLLDIGCGNGAFLKAFSYVYPNYELAGLELDEKNKDELESINAFKKLYIGNVDALDKCFDVIVMVHSLEHISDPVQYLVSVSNKLNQGGILLIEVPHLEKSPFDILIADHCNHFTLESLKTIIKRSKFKIVKATSDFIPKELSLICKWTGEENKQNAVKNVLHSESNNLKKCKSFVNVNIQWLLELANKSNNQSDCLGIFGTSISATWLATSLGKKVTFFVDEDVNRIGRTHMGKPIYDPMNKQIRDTKIIAPFRKDIGKKISLRYPMLDIVLPTDFYS